MYTIIFFDISSDKKRNSINKFLKRVGMHNCQFSVFIGNLKKSALREFTLHLKNSGLDENDKILMVPLKKGNLADFRIYAKNANIPYIFGFKNTYILDGD